MSDSAFPTASYPSCTLNDLYAKAEEYAVAGETMPQKMWLEIKRREAVAAVDYSQATDGERLRAVRAGKDIGQ